MRIYIRADGGTQIGLGHLVRCMALAQMLKGDFDIHFVCKEIPESIGMEIHGHGFLLTKIEEEDTFFDLLSSKEFVVLDHYGLDTDYQKKIKEIGSKLVCIDDLHDKEFYADLIINHAPGINPEDYRAQPYTQFALGLDYALLRPAFLMAAKKKRYIKNIETVLICFGGADIKDLTKYSLEVVFNSKKFKNIIVVTGAAYQYEDTLKSIILGKHNVLLYHAIDGEKMAELFYKTDVAIVPASGILFEVLASNIIPISGYYVDNQKEFYNGFKNLNAFYDAQDFSFLFQVINKIFGETHFSNRQILIDGLSDTRILHLFKTT